MGLQKSAKAGDKTLSDYAGGRLRLPSPLIKIYICLDEKQGFVALESLRISANTKEEERNFSYKPLHGKLDHFHQVPRDYNLVNHRDAKPSLQTLQRCCRYGRLLFQAATAKFTLRTAKGVRMPELHWQFHVEVGPVKVLDIYSNSGRHVGYVEANDDWISTTLEHSDETQLFEFVTLSACTMPVNWTAELYPVDEYLQPGKCSQTLHPKLRMLQRFQRSWRTNVPWVASQIMDLLVRKDNNDNSDNSYCYDDDGEDYEFGEAEDDLLPLPLMVNCMLINSVAGVWRRLGIGKIMLSGFLENNPLVSTVVLE